MLAIFAMQRRSTPGSLPHKNHHPPKRDEKVNRFTTRIEQLLCRGRRPWHEFRSLLVQAVELPTVRYIHFHSVPPIDGDDRIGHAHPGWIRESNCALEREVHAEH